MDLEASLRRFGVWQAAVSSVAAAALAAVPACAVATLDAHSPAVAPFTIALASVLGLATTAVAVSLIRVRAGVVARRASVWTFTPATGAIRSGALEVALDLGGFLLLRLGEGRRANIWLPLRRRGFEGEWHALRCAVYSPPPIDSQPAAPPRHA